eukprot:5987944-Karenia_brevis.AAC.1
MQTCMKGAEQIEVRDIPAFCRLRHRRVIVHLSTLAYNTCGGVFGGDIERTFGEGEELHLLYTYTIDGARKQHGHWRLLIPLNNAEIENGGAGDDGADNNGGDADNAIEVFDNAGEDVSTAGHCADNAGDTAGTTGHGANDNEGDAVGGEHHLVVTGQPGDAVDDEALIQRCERGYILKDKWIKPTLL